MRRSEAVTPEARDQLRRVYEEVYAEGVLEAAETLVRSGFPGLAAEPGDSTFDVEQVLTATPECIAAAGRKQFDEVEADPRDRSREVDYVHLVPAPPGANPTGWVVANLRTEPIDGLQEDRCAAG